MQPNIAIGNTARGEGYTHASWGWAAQNTGCWCMGNKW